MTNVKMLIADYPEDVKRLLREAGIIDTSLALARTDEVKPPIALPLPTSGSPVPIKDAFSEVANRVLEKYITHIATTPFTNQPVDPPVS